MDTFFLLKQGVSMTKKRRPTYSAEYRHRILELAASGRSAASLAKEFEPSAQTILNWIKQADLDGGRRKDGPTSTHKDELTRLRKENRRLREERDILKKAAAWFARESDSIPSGDSSS